MRKGAFSMMKYSIPTLILCILLCTGCGAGAEEGNKSTADLWQETEGETTEGLPQHTEGEAADALPQSTEDEATAGFPQSAEDEATADLPQNTKDEAAEASSPIPGALSVSGTQLLDAQNTPIQLRGVSTHGLAWYPDYINEECFRQLKDEWDINAVRLAMYTAESGGYCTDGDQDKLKSLVQNGVEYATDCGMYVIIDWHILSDGNPNTYLEEAKSFFQEMAENYADHTNILYEICNEPNGGTSWSDVKHYAEQVIEVIREKDPDGVILVGTPNWSQYVEQAAADPITGYDNIMYTLHFYAATHKEDLRDSFVRATEAGLPIFVSEFGICDASGNGAIDTHQADQWIELLDACQVSYIAWNLSNKSETSALFKSSCSKISGFTTEDLSDSGKWLYEKMTAGKTADDVDSSAGDKIIAAPEISQPSDNEVSEGETTGDKTAGDESSADNAAGSDAAGNGSIQNNLEIALEIVNSWTQDDGTYFQCSVKITNPTEEPRNSWSIRLTCSCDITLQDGWNGIYETEGNTLTISSMDYNGTIRGNSSIENIGFILKIQGDQLNYSFD